MTKGQVYGGRTICATACCTNSLGPGNKLTETLPKKLQGKLPMIEQLEVDLKDEKGNTP